MKGSFMSDSIFGKLLQDMRLIADLLDEYFDVVYENDFDPKQRLTEQERISKEEITIKLRNLIQRFKADIKLITTRTYNSKETQYKENRNLIDLANTTIYVSQKLRHYSEDDTEVENLRKILSSSISMLKENLIALNQRSTVKIYTWEEAVAKAREEIAVLLESDEFFNS